MVAQFVALVLLRDTLPMMVISLIDNQAGLFALLKGYGTTTC